MKTLRVNTEEDPTVIYVFADTHFGNQGQDTKLLAKHIQMCHDENAYWVHLGDWVEGITPKDKRHDVRLSSGKTIVQEYHEAYLMFNLIKGKGLGVLEGNHDYVISKTQGDNVEVLADLLETPYLGYGGYIKIKTPIKRYQLCIHHGHGVGFLLGAKTINIHRFSHKFKPSDIYLMGHVHTWIQHIDPKQTKKGHRYYQIVPSYFNPYDNGLYANYAVRSAVYPQVTGCARIEVGKKVIIEPVLE